MTLSYTIYENNLLKAFLVHWGWNISKLLRLSIEVDFQIKGIKIGLS